MSRIAEIPLVGSSPSSTPAGVAFLLASAPTIGAVQCLEAGEVEIRSGVPYVVARLTRATEPGAALVNGHALAQEGLDLFSVQGTQDLLIRDAEEEYLVWWTEAEGLVLRAVFTPLMKFGVPPATLVATDKDGNEQQPTASPTTHHLAFRFYRLAQTTEDLFDAYRNMYLAFEALLSSKYHKSKKEKEIEWLGRALTSSRASLRLDSLGLKPAGDLIEWVLKTVYADARLPLFHAKEGRAYFAPQASAATRQAVADALAVLTRIVLRIAETWFNARRVGGAVFVGWVYANVRASLSEAVAYASTYDGPLDRSEESLDHPRFAAGAKLETRLAPEFQRGKAPAILAVGRGTELLHASPLRRVDVAARGVLYMAHLLEAPVALNGVSRFESLVHVGVVNTNQPRSLFRH